MGQHVQPFSYRYANDFTFWLLGSIFICNFFWIFGTPILVILISVLNFYGFGKVIIDALKVLTVTAENIHINEWTWENWALYPLRQFVFNLILTLLVLIWNFIPGFSVMINLGMIGLIYVNMILY